MFKVGKLVAGNLYVHVNAKDHLPANVVAKINKTKSILDGLDIDFKYNVIKLSENKELVDSISFILYESFSSFFPKLIGSYAINLGSEKITYRNYLEQSNPPILHRKELLLPPDHPDIPKFAALTKQLEGNLTLNQVTPADAKELATIQFYVRARRSG